MCIQRTDLQHLALCEAPTHHICGVKKRMIRQLKDVYFLTNAKRGCFLGIWGIIVINNTEFLKMRRIPANMNT
jgi:hypothetical protein